MREGRWRISSVQSQQIWRGGGDSGHMTIKFPLTLTSGTANFISLVTRSDPRSASSTEEELPLRKDK